MNNGILTIQKKIIFICIITIIMCIYTARLFSIQVIDNYIYSRQADEISRREQILLTRRGEIFDRNFDQPLATNIDVFAVSLDLAAVPSDALQNLIRRLAQVLNTDTEYLWSRISPEKNGAQSIREIWSRATYRQIADIAERIIYFPGISWESRPARYYPNGALMTHVLGYTGKISPEELQILYNQGYSSALEIGKTGIERQYDGILRGRNGLNYGRVDASGTRVGELEDIPPVLGNSLVLTIDRHIQLLAEKALGERTGGVVILKPSTGEIIALASYPDYDPNIFTSDGGTQKIVSIQNDPRSPLINRTIQSTASPASTFKVLMSVAALDALPFDPLKTVYCAGSIFVVDRWFHCHDKNGHGHVNLYQALAESCNIYFYTLGKDHLEIENIVDNSLKFGMGTVSGIDLPGEVPGFVPSPEWKEKTYGEQWYTGDTINFSIGQGYLTITPLQLANVTAAVVNDGIIYQPHILKEVRNQTSLKLINEIEPRILRDLDIDNRVFEEVRKAMRMVITSGTPRDVITDNPQQIIGKTGTAEAQGDDLHSWFTAYLGSDEDNHDDGHVITVWVDSSNEWEWWAPKAANIIMHGITHGLTFEETVQDLQPLWYLPPGILAENRDTL